MTIYICPVGIDGSGKSICFKQILEILSKHHSVIGIGDQIWRSENQELSILINDWLIKAKVKLGQFAKTLKNRFFYKIAKISELILRVKLQKKLCHVHNPDFVVSDGSTLINLVGWGSYYRHDFFTTQQITQAIQYFSRIKNIPISKVWFYLKHIPEIFILNQILKIPLPIPDLIIFLNVSPQAAINRIAKRGEKRQAHETMSFLKDLQEAYILVCTILKKDFNKKVETLNMDDLILDSVHSKLEGILNDYTQKN